MDKRLYIPRPAKLIRVETLTEHEKIFEIQLIDGVSLGHEPGQFVEVSIPGTGEAPISVTSAPADNPRFELCIRNVGNVTGAIHKLHPGAYIGIRGPFGRGFPVESLKGNNIVFIAGGIGIIPMRSIIKVVLSNRDIYKNITILYGAKSLNELLFKDEIEEWNRYNRVKMMLTIDKSEPEWNGRTGVVTSLFGDVDFDSDNTYVIVVGPPVMYKFVILGLGSRRLSGNRILLSLERRMKCGIGKCGHCQIGSMYICKDGPVFSYNEIRHMKGVI